MLGEGLKYIVKLPTKEEREILSREGDMRSSMFIADTIWRVSGEKKRCKFLKIQIILASLIRSEKVSMIFCEQYPGTICKNLFHYIARGSCGYY